MAGNDRKLEKLLIQARKALMSERYPDAARRYAKLVRAVPDALVVQIEAARAFTRVGAVEDARRALAKVGARLSTQPDFLVPLASGYFALGDYGKAHTLLRQAWQAGERDHPVGMALVEADERMGKLGEAGGILEALGHDDPRANLFRGILHMRAGDLPAASALLEQATDGSGDNATFLRAGLLMAQCLERLGHYREAWDRMTETRKKAFPETALAARFDAMDRKLTDRVEHQFAHGLAPDEGPDPEAPTPLLLAGHPRSGNSVVAVHLAAERGLVDLDEIGAFAWAIEKGGLQDKLPRQLTPAGLRRARERYVEQMLQFAPESARERPWLDKNPGLELSGLHWLRVFPASEVICVRRAPLDCLVSCLFTYLPLNAFSLQFFTPERVLKSLQRSLRAQDRLVELAGGRVRLLAYEPFVREREGKTGADQGSATVLHSPNYAMARKPVHRRAVGRAEHYAEFLPRPLVTALRP